MLPGNWKICCVDVVTWLLHANANGSNRKCPAMSESYLQRGFAFEILTFSKQLGMRKQEEAYA
jgi:hypothetical protein